MRDTIKMMAIIAGIIGVCSLASCAEMSTARSFPQPISREAGDPNSVSGTLDALKQKTNQLKSYQCKIEYLFSQPVLESKTLRKGTLSYARFGDGSKLRINFDTLTQEDGPQQNYKECYIFDGQWLTHVDYQIKQVQKRQLAEANEPIDAFELAKRNFPLIGFDKTEDLKKEFDVNMVGESDGLVHLFLKVKPGSIYKDDYKSVDVWIDSAKSGLPDKITATTPNGDIYEIRFVGPKVNEPIDEKVFEVTIPTGFGKPEIIPLKK
jgi:outer membrane lipoprotein-sorting protein